MKNPQIRYSIPDTEHDVHKIMSSRFRFLLVTGQKIERRLTTKTKRNEKKAENTNRDS